MPALKSSVAAKSATKKPVEPVAGKAPSRSGEKNSAGTSLPVGKAVKSVPKSAVKIVKGAKVLPVLPVNKKIVSSVSTTAPPPPSISHTDKKPIPMTSPPALKPGRRSSARTPSHSPPPAPMVPTHAPDAAKASYSTMTERVIAPPPHVAAKKDPKLANNWKTKSANELTDDEVKAMPDAEYMNDKQFAFFRHRLSILKQEIHNSAGETTEHLREDTVVVPDPADRATIEEEHALELRTRDRERKLLKKIEQSIGRIDSGDYGYCDETGEPIGVGRLIARPTANLSLEAQQRRELKQKMFGD